MNAALQSDTIQVIDAKSRPALGTANSFAPADAVFVELQLGEAQLAAIWDQFQDVVASA